MHGARHSVTFDSIRVIAVDWSGAVVGAHRRIWLAEASPQDGLMRLESGRTREQIAEYLLDSVARNPKTAIGLDFAFSFPSWFIESLGATSAPELWQRVTDRGEVWLRDCAEPFWGRRGRFRSAHQQFRRTEEELRERGIWPKSVFQVGGAGAVGTGSIRGMPLLLRLRQAGASIWPFDPPGWPVVQEIYPRLLTQAVVKSRAVARQTYLAASYPELSTWDIPSEDAFDAAVSAVVMARCAEELASLPAEEDALARLEGKIWQPSALDWPRGAGGQIGGRRAR